MLVLTIIFSGVIYNRNLWAVPDQSFLHVFIWQFLVWLPWLGIFPFINRQLKLNSLLLWQWALASFLTTFVTIVWFVVISNFLSPYLDQPMTMFGLYKWWLVFWFTVSLLLFWAGIGFYLLISKEDRIPVTRWDDHRRLAIWQSGNQVIIDKDNIVWIGSRDYYAQIVLFDGERHWIRTRLNQFVKELPDEWFVRVHRSAIVNLKHLKKVNRHEDGFWEAVMSNGEHIRMSRAGKDRLEQAINIVK